MVTGENGFLLDFVGNNSDKFDKSDMTYNRLQNIFGIY